MDVFNLWFAQGAMSGDYYKGSDHITEERWKTIGEHSTH